MELQVSLSAVRLHSSTVKVGDSLIRVSGNKRYPGTVIATSPTIDLRFRELGVEKYSRDSFDRMVAKGILKPATKNEADGIKGAIRKDEFRKRVKTAVVVDHEVGKKARINHVTNKTERDMDDAYNGEERNRNATIESILADAKRAGYFDTYIERHSLTADLRHAIPKVQIEPLLMTEFPNKADYARGVTPLDPRGLRLRIPGLTYYVKITGQRSITKRWHVDMGAIGAFDAGNVQEIVDGIEQRRGRADRRAEVRDTKILKSAAKSRDAEVAGLHEAMKTALSKIEQRILTLHHSRDELAKFHKNMPDRGKQYPKMIEKAVDAFTKAEIAAAKLRDQTANNRKVTSSQIVKLRTANRAVEERIEAAEQLFSEIEYGFRRLDLSMEKPSKKRPTKRTV